MSCVTTLSQAKEYLLPGYEILTNANSITVAASVECGEWLNLAFSLYSLEKNKISSARTEWLKFNIGIHDFYAWKLRELSKYFRNYPRFPKIRDVI